MDHDEVIAVPEKPISQELLGSSIPARFAYTGADGDPRGVPVAFRWTGAQLVVCTLPTMAKVRALQRNPRVAVTIDTQDRWPPRVLLVRGTASTEHVEGVPTDAFRAEHARRRAARLHRARWTCLHTDIGAHTPTDVDVPPPRPVCEHPAPPATRAAPRSPD